jgi:hypothetical protein
VNGTGYTLVGGSEVTLYLVGQVTTLLEILKHNQNYNKFTIYFLYNVNRSMIEKHTFA